MKLFATLLLFLSVHLFAVDVVINTGKEKGKTFNVMNITNSTPFACKEVIEDTRVVMVQCSFEHAPPYKLTRSANAFFSLEFHAKDEQFLLSVLPKKKIKLFPIPYSVIGDMQLSEDEKPLSKTWQIIGYEDKLPFIKQTVDEGINFPISVDNYRYPRVGALNFRGTPIQIDGTPDIDEYLKIKSEYQKEQYENVVRDVKDVLEKYPGSVFKSDLDYYEIKSMYNMGEKADRETLIDLAKEWIKSNSADGNIPEILMIMADTYAGMGFNKEAQYYFDRIFFEYKESPYEDLAKIKLANSYLRRDNTQKAYELYNEALYDTKDVDTASLAAFRIAQMFVSTKPKEAGEFVKKIYDANPKYFKSKLDDSIALAESFADQKDYNESALISSALAKYMKRPSSYYETQLYKVAERYALAGEDQKAYDAYQEYLKQFPMGSFSDVAKSGLDSLFIKDASKDKDAIAKIDDIIDQYAKGSKLGDEAILKKAKIYLAQEKYQDVLAMQDMLKGIQDANTTVKKAATALAIQNAKAGDCKKLLSYIIDYILALPESYDKDVVDCGLKTGFSDLVKPIIERHLNDKNIEDRLFWLDAYAKILYGERKYRLFLSSADDLVTLSAAENTSPKYAKIYYLIFEAAKALNDETKMLDAVQKIEQYFPDSFDNLSVYKAIATYYLNKNDNFSALAYLIKLKQAQLKLNAYPYSPEVSMQIMTIYNQSKQFKKSINEAKNIKNLKDDPKFYYLLGSAYQGVNDNTSALKSFEQCEKSKQESPYKKLCGELKKLLQ